MLICTECKKEYEQLAVFCECGGFLDEKEEEREFAYGSAADAISEISRGETRNISFGEHNWRVLEKQDDRVLLLAENVFESHTYHGSAPSFAAFDSAPRPHATWESCSLRQYLNSAFLETFKDEDKKQILQVNNITPNNPWFDVDGGNDTSDKVFLLSIDEIVKYFGDSGKLQKLPDIKKSRNPKNKSSRMINDKYNDDRKATDYSDKNADWWLRSQGHTNAHAANIESDGGINLYGWGISCSFEAGIRPALWLKLGG